MFLHNNSQCDKAKLSHDSIMIFTFTNQVSRFHHFMKTNLNVSVILARSAFILLHIVSPPAKTSEVALSSLCSTLYLHDWKSVDELSQISEEGSAINEN